MVFHKNITGTNVHVPISWNFASAYPRTSTTGLVTADLYKFARQEDDNSVWMLTSSAPTWKEISGGANSGLNVSDDGTYVKFTYSGTDLLKVNKSTGQLLIAGGLDTDSSL